MNNQFIPEKVETMIRGLIDERAFRFILIHAKELNVSDITFSVGFPISVKKDNKVFQISKKMMTKTDIKRMIGFIYQSREGDESAYQRVMMGQDNAATYTFNVSNPGKPRVELRYRCLSVRDGEDDASLTMRLNNENILRLNQIGLSKDHPLYKNMFPEKGLVLITGSVDSGKTTLIYACLAEKIMDPKSHGFIDTYENPIEGNLRKFAIENNAFSTIPRQCPITPNGITDYSQGLILSLRRNSDIILLGEIRTQEDIMGCIRATLASGKLVMGTLHTDNVPKTLSRLINSLSYSDESKTKMLIYDLINSIHMLVSQKLIAKKDSGRVAAFESIVFTPEIRERLLALPVERISVELGLIMKENGDTMVDMARKHFEDGLIDEETFLRFEKDYSY